MHKQPETVADADPEFHSRPVNGRLQRSTLWERNYSCGFWVNKDNVCKSAWLLSFWLCSPKLSAVTHIALIPTTFSELPRSVLHRGPLLWPSQQAPAVLLSVYRLFVNQKRIWCLSSFVPADKKLVSSFYPFHLLRLRIYGPYSSFLSTYGTKLWDKWFVESCCMNAFR